MPTTAIAGERNSRRFGTGELVIKKGTANLDGHRLRPMPRAPIPYARSAPGRSEVPPLASQSAFKPAKCRRVAQGQACVVLGVAPQTVFVYNLIFYAIRAVASPGFISIGRKAAWRCRPWVRALGKEES